MPLILDEGRKEPIAELDANQAFQKYLGQLKEQISTNQRITLIHCPTFNFDSLNTEVARNRSYYVYPPTGLQCLKAALSDLDVEVDILDLNYLLLKKICETKSDTDTEVWSNYFIWPVIATKGAMRYPFYVLLNLLRLYL